MGRKSMKSGKYHWSNRSKSSTIPSLFFLMRYIDILVFFVFCGMIISPLLVIPCFHIRNAVFGRIWRRYLHHRMKV